MKTPRNLRQGDKIAIVSPATIVNPDYIDGAAEVLNEKGYIPVVMPHAKGPASGSFAASDADRLADIRAALADDEVRAIFCARGGYGCNHLIDKIPFEAINIDPKWIIGFSDISALHALWQRAGVVSLHAPMAKHLTECGPGHYCSQHLFNILENGPKVRYRVGGDTRNHPGIASGVLRGGNLAVINGLADTEFDPLRNVASEDTILFIEDVSEAIYAAERMLIRLRLSGKLQKLKGLICGHFTEYRPDRNYDNMEDMIANVMSGIDIPLAFHFPAGHTNENLPLPLGATARMEVGDSFVSLECD